MDTFGLPTISPENASLAFNRTLTFTVATVLMSDFFEQLFNSLIKFALLLYAKINFAMNLKVIITILLNSSVLKQHYIDINFFPKVDR